jgi:hypothetical protein
MNDYYQIVTSHFFTITVSHGETGVNGINHYHNNDENHNQNITVISVRTQILTEKYSLKTISFYKIAIKQN